MTPSEDKGPGMPRSVRLLLAAAIACCATAAPAQTMYRCGNSYQDHPCGGGQEGKVIGVSSPAPSAQAAATSAKASAQCLQRGIAAQKISWSREAGKTEQEQAAAARGFDQRNLIADVYSRRGSSVEVRAAIESDCTADEARAAQVAALTEAANRLRGGSASPGSRSEPVDNATAVPAVAPPPAKDDTASNEAARKQATCKQLNDQRDDVLARQRGRNNSASAMEQLRQQYRDADGRLRAAGC